MITALRNKIKLRTQFVVFLLVQSGIILGAAGLYVDWQVRKAVEDELGKKLIVIAKVAAEQIRDTHALQLVPGDENSRTLQRLQLYFAPVLETGTIARIMLLDPARNCYFDSKKLIAIGDEYYRARLDVQEINSAFSGNAATSRFFFDSKDQPFMSVYVPVEIDNDPHAAVLCMEGSAEGLQAIDTMQKILLTIGLLAIAVAFLSAGLIARQVTRPLEKLEKAAEEIGYGKYDSPLEQAGSSEIVILAQTIEKMRQAIDERQQRQQMMLAGVAHEVRNPLGGITLFAGVLQKTAPQDMQQHVARIMKEVNHLNEIISDFLSYARPVKANPGIVAVETLCKEVCAVIDHGRKEIHWDIAIEKGLSVFIDPDHFRQILSNILQNAVIAVKESTEAVISIVARRERLYTVLTITDNGPGIAIEDQDKVFQPFFTTRNEGTGLGLALVRLLAEENNCLIRLKPSSQGAKFQFLIPHSKAGNK
ncbi:MAG: HAMP domain-containing histidine kinase [Deferribacteres bacterium]|nr:HAMP domain-containing histidine kinase [Deferribacteres bacterium]